MEAEGGFNKYMDGFTGPESPECIILKTSRHYLGSVSHRIYITFPLFPWLHSMNYKSHSSFCV